MTKVTMPILATPSRGARGTGPNGLEAVRRLIRGRAEASPASPYQGAPQEGSADVGRVIRRLVESTELSPQPDLGDQLSSFQISANATTWWHT